MAFVTASAGSSPSLQSHSHHRPRAAPLWAPRPALRVPITLPSKPVSEAPCSESVGNVLAQAFL